MNLLIINNREISSYTTAVAKNLLCKYSCLVIVAAFMNAIIKRLLNVIFAPSASRYYQQDESAVKVGKQESFVAVPRRNQQEESVVKVGEQESFVAAPRRTVFETRDSVAQVLGYFRIPEEGHVRRWKLSEDCRRM
jgi:hypothetical protein